MKVSNSGPKSGAIGGGAAAGVANAEAAKVTRSGTGAAKSVGAEALSSSAKVDVSPRAQEMKRVKEMATPSSGVDEAKVARLQALIDSGQYKVDARAIADKLVDEHMKMNE